MKRPKEIPTVSYDVIVAGAGVAGVAAALAAAEEGAKVALIEKTIFPGGDDVMKAHDSVIIVTAGRIIEDLQDIFV